MSIYLKCIYVLVAMLLVLTGICAVILIRNRKISGKKIINNLVQKKASLYIKYNLKTKQLIINNYTYLNVDVSRIIVRISGKEDFLENVKKILKNKDDKFSYSEEKDSLIYNITFSYQNKLDDVVILKCEYVIERKIDNITLKTVDEIKKYHDENKSHKACTYYLNIREFNNINQRYGPECGDYILEVIKQRLAKVERKNIYCSYVNSNHFVIYYSGLTSKKKAIKTIQDINKKLIKPIDIGGIYVELSLGIGVCIGKHETLDEFIREAYIASDYAKNSKKYNIVIYNERMKLEENSMNACEKELDIILENKEININYYPVFYYEKNKFIGYISEPFFSSPLITFEKLKNVATQRNNINNLSNIIINDQLVNYIKKRPNKSSKIFINLKLEDLTTFLEVYLSNPSFSECKIVICLDVKKGYEMINKFSSISASIEKIIEERIEFATDINYNNMYDYDYILKNSNYLILNENIVNNMDSMVVRNKVINIIDLARKYDLKLFATNVKEYIQLENLLKYGVQYFSGSYLGKASVKPKEIEQSKTRVFAKFLSDMKKNKNN